MASIISPLPSGFKRRMNRIGTENPYLFAKRPRRIHRLLHGFIINGSLNANEKDVVVGLPHNRLGHDAFEIDFLRGKGRQEVAQASYFVL